MITMPTTFKVTAHTDQVGPGSTFVAIQGTCDDGANYIARAIEKGATKIIIARNVALSNELHTLITQKHIEIAVVENPRQSLAEFAAQAYNWPARRLKILAVTGTKGKTTSVFLLHHILTCAGYKTALLSTIKNQILDTPVTRTLTTQQPDYLHAFFDLCVTHGIEYVVMEVSAQALSLYRVHGIEFAGIILTNIDREHAEFYPNFDDYIAAKLSIRLHLAVGAPLLINADDIHCQKIKRNPETYTFGLSSNATYYVETTHEYDQGMDGCFYLPAQSYSLIAHQLVGSFNAYNIAGVLGLLHALHLPLASLIPTLKTFAGVPGRFEQYRLSAGTRFVIDYAHTPGSFTAILNLLKERTDHLIVIFGAGGGRDTTKRPLMGSIAAEIADVVILTTDNPRFEDPVAIVHQIQAGIQVEYHEKVMIELDREQAIRYAWSIARSSSIIALLGKGPDEYQEVAGIKTPFSERSIILSLEA